MNSEDSFLELAQALRERLNVIADHESRSKDPMLHMQRLKAVSEKIVVLQASLPADIPARLDHFLKGCSYDKALSFIEENCHGFLSRDEARKN